MRRFLRLSVCLGLASLLVSACSSKESENPAPMATASNSSGPASSTVTATTSSTLTGDQSIEDSSAEPESEPTPTEADQRQAQMIREFNRRFATEQIINAVVRERMGHIFQEVSAGAGTGRVRAFRTMRGQSLNRDYLYIEVSGNAAEALFFSHFSAEQASVQHPDQNTSLVVVSRESIWCLEGTRRSGETLQQFYKCRIRLNADGVTILNDIEQPVPYFGKIGRAHV